MEYIVAVFAVLLNDKGQFLSLRCTDPRFAGKWHLPAGRLEEGEPYFGVAFWGTAVKTQVRLSAEHGQCRWVSVEELNDLDAAYKDFTDIVRAAYRRAAERLENG